MNETTLREITAELIRARKKFPEQTAEVFLLALMEEVGELAQAYLQGKPAAEIYAEAAQVACVAVRVMEELCSPGGKG